MFHTIFFYPKFLQSHIIVIEIFALYEIFNRILYLHTLNILQMADGKMRKHLFKSQNSQQKNRSPFSFGRQ